jgi:hypothetical protein
MGQIRINDDQFETSILADHRGQLLEVGPDSGAIDAFGRQRVSTPFTLFDSTLRYTKRTDQWFEALTNNGTTSYLVNESTLNLTTTTTSGDIVLRRTKQRFPYQPGKSLMALQSFVGAVPTAGLVQEIGYFDDDNGVILRANGTSVQFVVRSKTTGSVVEEVVNQANWNIDTFPELDFSKAQILIIDLEWLGVGRVRCGFVIDGQIRYCHEFNHANNINKAYMTTAILPFSYRIENTTVQAVGRTLKQICVSLLSEGGYEPDGAVYTIAHSLSSVPNTSGERLTAAIRMASGRTGNVILPVRVDVACDSADLVQWRLRLNPTISGATWAPASNGRGNVETTTSGSSISGGTVVLAGLLSQGQSTNLNIDVAVRLALGVNASGESDVLALTVDSANSAKALGQLGWVEIA